MRNKFIILGIILNSFICMGSTIKEDAELIVDGENTAIRIRKNQSIIMDSSNNKDKNGDKSIRAAAWIENGATLVNQGNIIGGDHQYRSRYISLVLGGIDNNLKKEDNLLVLKNKTALRNTGTIEMGSLIHETTADGVSVGGSITGGYADYTKNTILATNSLVNNSGKILSKGDTFKNTTTVNVSVAVRENADYNKNVINATKSVVKNSGIIEYGSDYNPILQSYVGVNLLNLGLVYKRNVAGINAKNSYIENSGHTLVKGDIYKGTSTGGLNLAVLGADFLGHHKKWGINANNSYVVNTGTIEVERDFIKADVNGTIIDADFTDGPLIDLGILSFKNMTEKSVGVGLKNSYFFNDGGNIKVGANNKDTQITTTSGVVGIEADNSKIIFNNGKIELDGVSIFATNLKNNSDIIFQGDTYIDALKKGDKVNKKLLSNDKSSRHIIQGNLHINGDLVVDKGTNIVITDNNQQFGKIIGENITLNEDIQLDVSSLIDNKINVLENQEIIVAKNQIDGNGKIVSNNYLFDIKDKNLLSANNNVLNIDIYRKNFADIVENKDLGIILENNYSSFNDTQKGIYSLLAQTTSEKDFSKTVGKITDEKNINSLSLQIYDINKDINSQTPEIIRNLKNNEIAINYIDSRSKLSESSSSSGFKRKSKGSIITFGKNINPSLDIGIGFAYLNSLVNYNTSNNKNKIDSFSLRFFGNKKFENKTGYILEFTTGYNRSKNTRYINANEISGNTDLYTIGFNNYIYKTLDITSKLYLTPNVKLNMEYIYQDKYTENNNEYGIALDKNNSFFIEGGIGTNLTYKLSDMFNIIGEFNYSYDFINKSGDLKERIISLNDSFNIESSKLDRHSLNSKIGLEYNNDKFNIGVFYQKELLNKLDNDKFNIQLKYKL